MLIRPWIVYDGLSIHAAEEAVIALVRLYQTYTFELASELLIEPLAMKQNITISPKQGVPVTIVKRTH